jgi:hypothetical protein
MYLGCYVPSDQLAFAPVKELRWTVRVQGSVAYDVSGRPTFVPGPLSGVHADLATDPTDTPTMSASTNARSRVTTSWMSNRCAASSLQMETRN